VLFTGLAIANKLPCPPKSGKLPRLVSVYEKGRAQGFLLEARTASFSGDEMKRKMHYQVQPREMVPPRTVPRLHSAQEQVQQEIQNFRRALDSYPARAAKDRGISFHQHLCSFFTDARADRRTRRQ
jgi:hypothetical protein